MADVYYYTGRGWQQIASNKLIYPNQQTYGIDSGTDTMQISFYASTNFCLPPETVIKIHYRLDDRYFIVKDSSFQDLQYSAVDITSKEEFERICTLQLVEPIEILKGFKVQACTFAQKRYKLKNIIIRLCKLAGFDYGKITIENPNKIIKNRIDFASTTLYLALFELARKFDCIPYLDFETNSWTIKFQRLDGFNESVHSDIFLTPFIQSQYSGEGLAKNVYMEANNVQTGGVFVSSVIPIATDGSSTININNFGLKLTDNITNLVQLIITTKDNTKWYFRNNRVISYFVGSNKQERTIYIISKSGYEALTTTEKKDYNNIYIYWENDIVYLHEFEKLRNHPTPDNPNMWDDEWLYIYKSGSLTNNTVTGTLHLPANGYTLWNNSFSITGQTTTTNQIPFYAFNESNYEKTVFYNQTSQKLDPITMGDSLQSYIDNMQNEKYFRKGNYGLYEEIPKEGSVIKIKNELYIVNSLTIVENVNNYDVTFNLVKKHAQRREYMGADTTLQLNDMTNKDIINSNNINVTQINYSMFDKIEVVNELDVNIEQMALIAPLRASAINLWHWFFTFYYYQNSVLKEYNYKSFGTVDNFGNSLVFYAKALNNMVWYQEADNSGNLIPKNYTNSSGEIRKVKIQLQNENDNMMYQQENEGTAEIPIKDKHEIFTQTLQFIYKGVGNTIVRNEYVEYLLTEDLWEECTILAYDTNIGKFDDKPNTYLDLTGGYISINTEQQYILISLNKILDVACKSIVVRGDTDIFFIKNYDEITNINTGEIKIYYNIKKPLLPRTGIKGYNF